MKLTHLLLSVAIAAPTMACHAAHSNDAGARDSTGAADSSTSAITGDCGGMTCGADEYCHRDPCDGPGRCEPIPDVTLGVVVCGCDGSYYPDAAAAARANVTPTSGINCPSASLGCRAWASDVEQTHQQCRAIAERAGNDNFYLGYCSLEGNCEFASGCEAESCCIPGAAGDNHCVLTFGDARPTCLEPGWCG